MKNIIDFLTNLHKYNPNSGMAQIQAAVIAILIAIPLIAVVFYGQKANAEGIRTSHLVAGTAGYVIGKQGNNSTTAPQQQPTKQFTLLPVDCRLSEGVCISPFGKPQTPQTQCQATYGASLAISKTSACFFARHTR